jgi:hypothetical protein
MEPERPSHGYLVDMDYTCFGNQDYRDLIACTNNGTAEFSSIWKVWQLARYQEVLGCYQLTNRDVWGQAKSCFFHWLSG